MPGVSVFSPVEKGGEGLLAWRNMKPLQREKNNLAANLGKF